MKKRVLAAMLTLTMVLSLMCGVTVFSAEAAATVVADEGWTNATYDSETQILTNVDGGYSFKWTGNNTISYNGTTPITAEKVVIPSSVNGVAIKKVSSNPFGSGNTVKNVIFSEGIDEFYKPGFSGYTGLETVRLPSTMKTLGQEVFKNCNSLNSINIPNGITSLGNYTFPNCYALKSIELPDSITSLGTGVFSGTGLESLVVPAGVTYFPKEGVKQCGSLKSIVFKGNITGIGGDAFRMASAIEEIVFEGNTETAPTLALTGSRYPLNGHDIEITISYPASARASFEAEEYKALWTSKTIFKVIPGLPVAADVTVTGGNVVGDTLTASYTYTDPKNNPESGSTGTWERADDFKFETNVETIKTEAVSATTGSTYTLTNADDGKYIRFTVIPRHGAAELNVGDPVSFVYATRIRKPQTVPVVTLTSPGVGFKTYVNSEVALSATATCDNTTITKIEFYANDELVATANQAPFEATWTPTVDGDYTIKAKAYNALGENASTEGVAIKIYSLSESIEPVWASKWSYDFNNFTSTDSFTSDDGLPTGFPHYQNYSSTITSVHGLFGKADDDYHMALASNETGKGETARMYFDTSTKDPGNNVYFAEMDVAFSTTNENRYFFCTRTSRGTYTNFYFSNGGGIGYTDSTGNHSFVDSEGNSVKYEANKWYHIGMVLDFKNTAVEFHLSYDDEKIVVKTKPQDWKNFDYTSEISTKGIRNQGQTGIVYMDNMSYGQVQDSLVTSILETPIRGSYIKGNAITFKGYAKDSRGNAIEKVEIYGNGSLIGEATGDTYNFTKTLEPGSYAIIAKAISSDGLVGYSNAVNVVVSGISLSNVFADGMVLQRGRPLKIAGTGIDGTKVTVKLLDSQGSTTVANGKWEVILPAQPANKGTTLTITADGVDTVFNNVAVGEVILCTGQSNMQYSLNKFSNLIGEADQDYADIRLFKQNSSQMNSPQTNISDGRWTPATQVESTGFSATGFLTGKYYYLSQNGEVPVGLIYAAHGGSAINVWMPSVSFSYDPDVKGSSAGNTYYNKMVAPFTSTTIGHVLWYQGCANTYFSNNYEKLLTAYIDGYREVFNDEMMDFTIVQLPKHNFAKSYGASRTAIGVREGEWNVSQYLDRVATVVSIDTGDVNNIHPSDKLPIAQRAVLAIRHFTEPDNTSLVWKSPSMDSFTVADGKMTITFKDIAGGLSTTDGQAPRGFKVAGDDGVFADANATLVGNTVVIDVSAVTGTPKVRYAWEDVITVNGEFSQVNLVGGTGLPMAPFRTDNDRYHFTTLTDGVWSGMYNYTPMVRKVTATDINDGKSVITVNARDYDDSITTVEVFADGKSIGFATPVEGTTLYTLDWTGATVGTHSLHAIATDTAGATSVKRDASHGGSTISPRQFSVSLLDLSLVTLSGSLTEGVTATAKDFTNQKLIIAAYNGDYLHAAKISDEATVSFTAAELAGATNVKAFLFTDLESITPVAVPAVLIK